jgi:hypothetical protein
MFIVLANTDEYVAASVVVNATTEVTAAWHAACAVRDAIPQYRCCGIFETEAAARAAIHSIDRKYDPEVAYLFKCRRQEDGRFVVYMGDNGWEFLDSTPTIVLGMFNSREGAAEWADNNGSQPSWVFELDADDAKRLAVPADEPAAA